MLNKFFAILLLVFSMPLLVVIGSVVFIQTRQNPIFIQQRGLTLSKYRFNIYKFRTMSGALLKRSVKNTLSRAGDERNVFLFGKFLRKTGLDELPQLINILKGEMNFVGPRPLDLTDLRNIKNHFNRCYRQRETIDLLPGLTGYWQINRNEERSITNLIELDNYYHQNRSFTLNINILFASLFVAFKGENENPVIVPLTEQNYFPSMEFAEIDSILQ